MRPLLLLILLAANTEAQTVRTWVATTGSDANPCSRSAPCRNFDAAIAAVDAGGEVVALESGGYGPFEIDKSVSVIAPSGIHAAIAPTAGFAVTVDMDADDVAVVRGLYLNSQGAIHGIHFVAGYRLYVESSAVNGFSSAGVYVAPAFDGQVRLRDSVIRNNGVDGLYLNSTSSGSGLGVVEHCRFENNPQGIRLGNRGRLIIRDSSISGSTNGIYIAGSLPLGTTARADIESCVIHGHGEGYGIFNGFLETVKTTIANTTVAHHAFGITLSGGSVWLTGNTVTMNGTGLQNLSGSMFTRGENTVIENGADHSGSPTITYPAN